MYQLNVITPALMKISINISQDIALNISSHLLNKKIQRDDLFNVLNQELKNLKATSLYLESIKDFVQEILKESNASVFILQIEASPAHQKVFHSADDLPIANNPLIVVFKDKDIISAEYCNKHDAWHTQQGDIDVRQIHQWAYRDDFYNQLNLPEFPEPSKRPDPSELIKGLKGLFEALSDAAVEVHVHKVNSKGNSLKDMFDEVFGEKSDIFKSNSKH